MLETGVELAASPKLKRHSPELNIMLFELAIYGHHATYIRHLVRYWCENQLSGQFYIIVPSRFLEKHSDIPALAQLHRSADIQFLALTPEEETQLESKNASFLQRKTRAWQEWNLMCDYASRLRVSHCFLASFDFFRFPFLWGRKTPCPVSSIYFRPTFHYSTFFDCELTRKERRQGWWEKLILLAISRRPHLHRLFCLDPFAVEALCNTPAHRKIVALADPISPNKTLSTASTLKERLQIHPKRQVFLLFGELTHRKGVTQLLDAILMLPSTLCQRLCLLIVGRCGATDKYSFQAKVNQVLKAQPVQIHECYEYISEQDVHDYFQASDVVLAPYQKHVGMSGILLQAAAAKTPVLSSNYGLMGELVRRYDLGVTVDSTHPEALMAGLTQFLEHPLEQFYTLEKMEAFVQQNTAEKFAKTIFDELHTPT